MSPFQVATDKDVGFVAASSFAGGRMATDLKDTPLAYSVLTKEFIESLNLVDTEKAMEWAVNSSTAPDDGQDRIYNYDGYSRTKSRGVQAKVLRNFFELGRFGDTYSQDRIDFARGTNALLIGNGGLGGALIMLSKQARTDKRVGALAMNLGSYGERRATLDFNQPLTGQLAVRANLLWQDSDSWRHRGFDRRNGIHLTTTYRPAQQTEIRVEYERYRSKELAALSHINDRVSGWDGVTVFDAPTASFATANQAGVARDGSSTSEYRIMVPSVDATTVINYANTWKTIGGGQSSQTPVNGVLPLSTSSLGAAGSNMIDVQNEPPNRYSIALAHSSFTVPGRKDFMAPDYPTLKNNYDVVAAYVQQQAGEHIFLEAAWESSKPQRLSEAIVGRLTDMQIDLNRNLPTGAPNPHFLHAYSDASAHGHIHSDDKFHEYRAAAAYVLDNTRFGSFHVNLIAGHLNRKTDNRFYVNVMNRDADIRNRPFTDTIGFRYYIDDSSQPFVVPTSVKFVNPVAGTTQQYAVSEIIDLNKPGAENQSSERNQTYYQSALSAKLFSGRLNLLAGVRHDQFNLKSHTMLGSPRTSYPTDWDGRTFISRPAAPGNYYSLTSSQKGAYNAPDIDQSVNTVSYGGVYHVKPWLSGFYNFAQTYDTSRSVADLNGLLVDPLRSKGWDTGIRLTLLDGRISASFSAYGSVQKHTIEEMFNKFLYTITESNVVGDLSATGRNNRGLGAIPNQYFDYLDSKAKGTEFEVVANLTKGWRLTYNLAFPKTLTTNRFQETWAYINANESLLRQIVIDAGATIDANNVASTTLSASQAVDAANAVAGWNALQDFKKTQDPAAQTVNGEYKYTTNLFTDYRFTEGRLKNLRVGAGVQYRSKKWIGNRASDTIVNPANPLTAIDDPTVDVNTPVYMSAWYLVTATVGYQFKLNHGMLLNLDLRISNLLDEDGPIYYGAGLRPAGGNILSPARVTSGTSYYYLTPRSISLTTRLSF